MKSKSNSNPRHERADNDGTEIPGPRRDARWRWSTPRRALGAGGALAAVVGLGASASAAGAAGTSGTSGTSGTTNQPPAGARGRPPGGATPPAVGGRITALSGDDITVHTRDDASTVVVYSAGTTFKTRTGPNGASTTSSDSALKVGDFIGVQGTKNSDGTVTASTVMIGGPQPGGKSGPAGPPGAAGKGGRLPTGAPSA